MFPRILEGNSAVKAIIPKGYSQKLRHLAKTHRVNVASAGRVFAWDLDRLEPRNLDRIEPSWNHHHHHRHHHHHHHHHHSTMLVP